MLVRNSCARAKAKTIQSNYNRKDHVGWSLSAASALLPPRPMFRLGPTQLPSSELAPPSSSDSAEPWDRSLQPTIHTRGEDGRKKNVCMYVSNRILCGQTTHTEQNLPSFATSMQVIHLADRGPQSEYPPPRSCDIVNTILTLPVQYSRAQTRHLLVGSWVLLLRFVVVLIPMLSDPNRVRSLNLYI